MVPLVKVARTTMLILLQWASVALRTAEPQLQSDVLFQNLMTGIVGLL